MSLTSVARMSAGGKTIGPFALALALGTVIGMGGDAGAATVVSRSEDRQALALTVYNSGIGLVRDTRLVPLEQGVGEVRFRDVATEIIPSSVHVGALKGGVALLEQRYEYDLQTPERLMQKYVGKAVRVVDRNPATGEDRVIDAVLLSAHGQPVYRVGDEIHVGLPGRLIFPEPPAGLVSTPTLVWQLRSGRAARVPLDVSYLANQIGWQADYTLVLPATETEADLSAWATIDNRSGGAYPDARLRLVAGQLNRVHEDFAPQPKMRLAEAGMAARMDQAVEESFSEYHLYTIERPVTVAEYQTTQLPLFESVRIGVEKRYAMSAPMHFFRQRINAPPRPQPVDVTIEFENEQANRLGRPLPAGTVRIYSADSRGDLQLAGEDRLPHTPADERVRLSAGKAFDVVGERVQTEYQVVAKNVWEVGWKIELRNRKKDHLVVNVFESLPNEWQVLSSSHPWEKIDVQTIRFDVPVSAGTESVLEYRVRIRSQ